MSSSKSKFYKCGHATKGKSIPASRTAPWGSGKSRKDSPMSILFLGPRDPQTLLTSWEGPLQGMRDTTAMRILYNVLYILYNII